MPELHIEINSSISKLHTEIHASIYDLHIEMHAGMSDLHIEIHTSIFDLRTKIDAISTTQHTITSRLTQIETCLASVEDVIRELGSQFFVSFIYDYFIFVMDNNSCFINLN